MPNYPLCQALLNQTLDDVIAAYQAADAAIIAAYQAADVAIDARLDALEGGGGGGGTVTGRVYLLDYGTLSTAGTALNAAMAALPSGGGTVELPGDTMTLDVAVTFSKNNIRVMGQGPSSKFNWNGSSIATAFAMADTTARSIFLRDFRITQTSGSNVGTAINATHFSRGRLDNIYIEGSSGSSNAPIIGVYMGGGGGANGSYYNVLDHCRIQAGGASSYCIKIDSIANSNTVSNARILGSTSTTGIYVDAHACCVGPRFNVETNLAYGIDIGTSGDDCLVLAPYLEGNDVNLRVGATASVTVVGGVIIDADTTNIIDAGSLGLHILNCRMNRHAPGNPLVYDSVTYKTNNNGLVPKRWIEDCIGGIGVRSDQAFGNVVGAAGVWSMVAVDVPETVYTDGMAYVVGDTANGNVTGALYGPASAESGASLTLVANSASTPQAATTTNQVLDWVDPRLIRAGRYYLGLMNSGTTGMYRSHGTTVDTSGRSGYFSNSGGYAAGPNSTSASGWVANGSRVPALKLRCAVAPTL